MPYFTLFVNKSDETKGIRRNRVFFAGRESAIQANGRFKLHDREQSRLAKASSRIGVKFPRVAVTNFVGKDRKSRSSYYMWKDVDTWQLSVNRQLGLIFLTLEGIFLLFLPRLTLQHAISAGSAWHVHKGTLCIGQTCPVDPTGWFSAKHWIRIHALPDVDPVKSGIQNHPLLLSTWPAWWRLVARTPTDVAGKCLLIRSHIRPLAFLELIVDGRWPQLQ